MKRILVLLLGAVLILSVGATGAGCTSKLPFEDVTDAGKIEVRVTDAPAGEEVTSILVTVSGVEIHKAGTEQEGGGIQQQGNQQKGKQQQKSDAGEKQGQGQSRGVGRDIVGFAFRCTMERSARKVSQPQYLLATT